MATLQEIADRAGVSLNTASRILAGRIKGVRKDAVARSETVLKIAQELNYRPNTSAQAIRSGRFGGIALLLSTNPNRSHMPRGMLEGIEAVLVGHDMHLTLTRVPDERLTQQGVVPKILRRSMTDGLLINYTDHIPDKMIDLIEREKIPSVWINTNRETDCVRPDDFAAAQQATKELIKRGHRRIAYVDYHNNHSPLVGPLHYSVADRSNGYIAAMEAAGLTPQLVWEERDVTRERMTLASALLASPDRPTAIVAYSPFTALPLLIAAFKTGRLDVPKDLSLITFSDILSDDAGLALSAMLIPTPEIGRLATEMLLRKIEEPLLTQPSLAVPFVLALGSTIASPRPV